MTDERITQLLAAWQREKDAEDAAKDARHSIETQIVAILDKSNTFKGTVKLDGVTVTYGETVKVDSEVLQFLAAQDHIGYAKIENLFRWKAELRAKEWKEAPEEIKRSLMNALETKPSKPAFSRINTKEK